MSEGRAVVTPGEKAGPSAFATSPNQEYGAPGLVWLSTSKSTFLQQQKRPPKGSLFSFSILSSEYQVWRGKVANFLEVFWPGSRLESEDITLVKWWKLDRTGRPGGRASRKRPQRNMRGS